LMQIKSKHRMGITFISRWIGRGPGVDRDKRI
jgi:hypothetical protein